MERTDNSFLDSVESDPNVWDHFKSKKTVDNTLTGGFQNSTYVAIDTGCIEIYMFLCVWRQCYFVSVYHILASSV